MGEKMEKLRTLKCQGYLTEAFTAAPLPPILFTSLRMYRKIVLHAEPKSVN